MFFEWGPIHVRWYAVMIALGFFAALFVIERLSTRFELDKDKLVNGALVSFIGGIIGARLYFVALNLNTYWRRPEDIIATWQGGLSIHGGILGGLLAGLIYARLAKVSFARACDIFGVGLPLGQAIGRWGNFFNSEAFGRPVGEDFFLKLEIPPQNRPLEFQGHQYFHPAFLYESIWDLMLFGVLYFYVAGKLKNYPGATFMVYLALYSLGRLLIEPIRTDSIMLGAIQAPIVASGVSLLLAVVGFLLILSKHRRVSAG
jgi:phosphatidylglycerol:prolipoprotein diacylglycerol transferase